MSPAPDSQFFEKLLAKADRIGNYDNDSEKLTSSQRERLTKEVKEYHKELDYLVKKQHEENKKSGKYKDYYDRVKNQKGVS